MSSTSSFYCQNGLLPPLLLHDDQGWRVPHSECPEFRRPLFINVESSQRDMSRFVNPTSFSLNFPAPITGVYSIEVIDITVPSANTTDPPGMYFFLGNGLVEGTAAFRPQGVVSHYIDMETERTRTFSANSVYGFTNPDISATPLSGNLLTPAYRSPAPVAPGVNFSVGKHSFGKFPYNSARPVQIWERNNARKVNYFDSARKLSMLEFSLLQRDGTLYDLDPLDNWNCTLMVCATQSPMN